MAWQDDIKNFSDEIKQSAKNAADAAKDATDEQNEAKTGKGCTKWIIATIIFIFLFYCCSERDTSTTPTDPTTTTEASYAQTYVEDECEYLVYTIWQQEYANRHGITLNAFTKERIKLDNFLSTSNYADVYVTEDNIFGGPRYKLTIERSKYLYNGETQDNRPDGYGVLLKKSDFSYGAVECDGMYYNIIYIGSFSEGQYSGYGLEFYEPDDNDFRSFDNTCPYSKEENEYLYYYMAWVNYVKYDGNFKKSEWNGYGNKYATYLVNRTSLSTIIGDTDITNVIYDEINVGTFKDGARSGDIKVYKAGILRYDGEMKNDAKNGSGCSYFRSGNIEYNGEWKNDMRHGTGTLYDEDGNVIYKGEWKNDDFK